MFKLNGNYEVDRKILKCVYIRYSRSETSTIVNRKLLIVKYIIFPRGDFMISLLGSPLRANFDVLYAATNNRYIDGDDIRLVNEGPIALSSNYKLQSSSEKHIEEIDHAHIVCLMYKLVTSARNTDDLCIGFDSYRDRRKRELTNNI